MSQKTKKTERYLLYFTLAGLAVSLLGGVAFGLQAVLPSIVAPTFQFEGILGTIPLTYGWLNLSFGALIITFPWFNFVALAGLVMMLVGALIRFFAGGEKNTVYRVFLGGFIILLLLTIPGIAWNGNYQPPPPNNVYPTPTPYNATPPPTYPTYTPYPYPTSDPTAFSITQIKDVETVSGTYYTPPTVYKTVVNVDPVFTAFDTHQVEAWGTFDNWNFDVYYKVAGTTVWHYGASGVTDGFGHGYAYIPLDESMSRETFTVVAFLDPSDPTYTNYFASDVSDAAVAAAVASGTCRASSNFLSFTVEVEYVL